MSGDFECNREWLLKNSFQGISTTKFVRKLLNVRPPWTPKPDEVTALVPFQHPRDFATVYPEREKLRRRGALQNGTVPLTTAPEARTVLVTKRFRGGDPMLGLSFLAHKSDPLFTKSAALRLAAAVLVLATAAWSQSTEKVLIKSLIGGNGGLFFDQQSNFYGTEDRLTRFGAVYRVHHYLNGTWGIKVLYHFTGGSDGAHPQSHPVLDNAGNLYGATSAGGSNICSANSPPDCGVVFELTPTSSGWTEKVLYDFTHSADGFDPSAGVILDNVGNLYGTTYFGGPHAGTIFELVPNSNGTWTHRVLYGFTGGADGGFPLGGLVRDSAGNLYGTTHAGGRTGHGTIFELSPGSNGAWTFHLLHSFCVRTNCSDGDPGSGFASVILDSHGNLYGMTSAGGQVSVSCPAGVIDGCGTAFKLTHTTTGAWTFQKLYAFCSLDGCIDGTFPGGGLVLDGAGNLYGTTLAGGSNLQGFGTVFRLSHVPGSPWTEDVLHSFCALPDCADGIGPLGSLVLDTAGNLFGTTPSVVFEVIP